MKDLCTYCELNIEHYFERITPDGSSIRWWDLEQKNFTWLGTKKDSIFLIVFFDVSTKYIKSPKMNII